MADEPTTTAAERDEWTESLNDATLRFALTDSHRLVAEARTRYETMLTRRDRLVAEALRRGWKT